MNDTAPARRDFLKIASMASLAGAGVTRAQQRPAKLTRSKRDRMEAVLNMSSRPDYVPAGFFMHFGVRGDAAVKAHLDYFRGTGMDFVKIQFDEQTYPANNQIKTPRDWTKLPVLGEQWFEPTLYLLKALVKELKSEALIIQTLYSPYQLAKQAVPWQLLVQHINQDPEAVCRGFENVTLSLMHLVQAAARVGVDGFYTCAQGGETNRIADLALFEKTIKRFDMFLYKETAHLVPYNIMHLCDYDGTYTDFAARFEDYPGKVVNVPLMADGKPLALTTAAEIFKRPVMGGIDRHGIVTTGTPEQARKAALDVLARAPSNFVLSADCTVSAETPIANLRTAIEAAHEYRA